MNRAVAIVGILAFAVLNLLLSQLSPLSSPLVILAVLASAYLSFLTLVYFLLLGWFGLWEKIRSSAAHETALKKRHQKVLEISLLLAALPIVFLLLHTEPNGRWWILLLSTLALCGCFLLWRKKPQNP